MFCPMCGTESAQGLNYCKRCGANLNMMPDRTSPLPHSPKLTGMFAGVAGLSIVAVIAMFGAIGSQTIASLPPPYLTGVLVAACATVFGIVALLIRLILKLTGLSDSAPVAPEEPARRRAAVLLPTPPASFGSVTENTTRGFPHAERPTGTEQTPSAQSADR